MKMDITKITNIIIAVLITLFLLNCGSSQSGQDAGNYNVILISLDTTRYDYIDTGAGAKADTPALRTFSQDAVVYANTFAPAPETLPSHLSAFTSRYPHELGVTNNADSYKGQFPMIQQVLKQKGYYTYGVISLWTVQELGIRNRFDEYDISLLQQEKNQYVIKGDKISRAAVEKLRRLKEKKFFMFVHFSDPHAPYAPPGQAGDFDFYIDDKLEKRFSSYSGILLRQVTLEKGTRKLFFKIDESAADFKGFIIKDLAPNVKLIEKSATIEYKSGIFGGSYYLTGSEGWIRAACDETKRFDIQFIPQLKTGKARLMYRKEVEFMDSQVGKFLEAVKQEGLMDKTIIAVFSDHGEGLGERDGFVGHTEYVNRQFVQVPFILRVPGETPRRVEKPVSLVSLSSMVLLHIAPGEIPDTPSSNDSIYSFVLEPSSRINKISVIHWPYQGIYYWDKKGSFKEFYDLEQDDSFSQDRQVSKGQLNPKDKKVYYRCFRDFVEMKKNIPARKRKNQRKIDKEKLKKLKGLGYLN